MIKLLDLLIEAENKTNKAIIMAGSAGAGKSTIVKQLRPDLQNSIVNKIRPDLKRNNWLELNADNYVEDKNSPMYNNLAKASNYIEKIDLPKAISSGDNFLYDTTASNIDRIKKVADSVGEAMMIMVYTNPVVSFLRNFKRERRVPTVGVLSSWNNVYKNISQYSNIFGDNFVLVVSEISPAEQKMVEEFEKAFKSNKLKEFFEELLSSGQFKSSFKKDPTKEKTPEELAKSKALLDKQIDTLSSQFSDIEKQVELLKSDSVESAVSKAKSFINS